MSDVGVRLGEGWLYRAQPVQARLHRCAARHVLYGGAAGGGKSVAGRWHAIMACLARPGFQALLLRRTYPELDDTHVRQLEIEVPAELGSYNRSRHLLSFPNGSILRLGHCQSESDVTTYLSSEWGMIVLDEATTFTPRQIELLRSRLRTTLEGVRPQLVALSNPGGPSHTWFKRRFIDRRVSASDDATYDPADYEYIPARLDDNRYLDQAEYRRRLEALPPAQRAMYLAGDWSVVEGCYFEDWDAGVHVVPPEEQTEIPQWWEREAGMDWGYSPHPGALVWLAYDPAGRALAYQELTFEKSAPRDVARMIAARSHTPAERAITIRGDTQMWVAQPESGVSIAEQINEELAELGTGIVLLRANKDRLNGWARVHQYLAPHRPLPDGSGTGPWLRVWAPNPETGRGCPGLIETLPLQTHEEPDRAAYRLGDMKKRAGDDVADALRYAIIAREPLTSVPEELVPFPSHERRVARRTRELVKRALARHSEEFERAETPWERRAVLPREDEDWDPDAETVGGVFT